MKFFCDMLVTLPRMVRRSACNDFITHLLKTMKPTFRNFSLAIGITLFGATSAHAQVYWDTNSTTTGFGTASGTWGTDSFWNNSTTGGAGTFSLATAGAINFGNGATGLGAGTITVDGTQTASGGLTFASGSGAIVLSGGTINLPASTTITVNNTTNTISSNITGAATTLAKAGPAR
jgi:hypothetical protein